MEKEKIKKCSYCGGLDLKSMGTILEDKVDVFVCDSCGEDSVFANEA